MHPGQQLRGLFPAASDHLGWVHVAQLGERFVRLPAVGEDVCPGRHRVLDEGQQTARRGVRDTPQPDAPQRLPPNFDRDDHQGFVSQAPATAPARRHPLGSRPPRRDRPATGGRVRPWPVWACAASSRRSGSCPAPARAAGPGRFLEGPGIVHASDGGLDALHAGTLVEPADWSEVDTPFGHNASTRLRANASTRLRANASTRLHTNASTRLRTRAVNQRSIDKNPKRNESLELCFQQYASVCAQTHHPFARKRISLLDEGESVPFAHQRISTGKEWAV